MCVFTLLLLLGARVLNAISTKAIDASGTNCGEAKEEAIRDPTDLIERAC